MTSGTVDFRFGQVDLENLNLCLKQTGICRVVNLKSNSFFLSLFNPTVFDGNKWCFCVWKITRQYSLMVKNLEIKPSFLYFSHGIHRDYTLI